MNEDQDVNTNLDQAQDLDDGASTIEPTTDVVETEEVNEQATEDQEEVPEEASEPKQKTSQAVPYERFQEVNEKAKEAELLRRENEFYRQQLEARSSQQYLQQPNIQETPEEIQAKEILKNKFGLVDSQEVDRRIQAYATDQRAITTILSQESSLKQKFAGRDVPVPSAQELVTWYEARGHQVDKNNIPANLLEDIYYLKYRDKLDANYAATKPRVAPMAKTSAPTPGKQISEDDFFNLPPDKTDEYFNSLKK